MPYKYNRKLIYILYWYILLTYQSMNFSCLSLKNEYFLNFLCNIFDAVLVPNVKNNYQNDDTIENYFMIQEQ